MVRRKGFVDKGLYGLKEKLSPPVSEDDNTSPAKVAEVKEETIPTTAPAPLPKSSDTTEEVIKIDDKPSDETPVKKIKPKTEEKPEVELPKDVKKALQKRLKEYNLTKKFITSKIDETILSLDKEIDELKYRLESIEKNKDKLNYNLEEVEEIEDKEWSGDFTFELGIAMKTVENARLQNMLIEEQRSPNKTSVVPTAESIKNSSSLSTTQNSSLIPEITSLSFKQLFKMGFSFFMPIGIVVLISAIIIAAAFFISMGGFF